MFSDSSPYDTRLKTSVNVTYATSCSIVAIHGLAGDALKTWTIVEHSSGSKPAEINWLSHPNLLPHYLPTARILTWGYNANISSMKGKQTSSDRILQHAQTLVAQLSSDREVSGYIPQ
jgi:protein SERAC1